MSKIKAFVTYHCPNMKQDVTVSLCDLDIEENPKHGFDVEIYCECKSYHTLDAEYE